MTAITITNFGGEIPRVSPRVLPAQAAQLNRNLLATSVEFRPLLGDAHIQSAPSGALSVYRLARQADGQLRSDPAQGWLIDASDKSHVKGQVNDDATERTAVSWNAGTQRPRIIDATGADRLLGVPPPPVLSLTLNEAVQFTREDADLWADETLYGTVTDALIAALVSAHVVEGKPLAGAKEMYDMRQNTADGRYAEKLISLAVANEKELLRPEFGAYEEGGQCVIPICALPLWAHVPDMEALQDALRLIESPVDGGQLFPDKDLPKIARGLAGIFDPAADSIASARSALDGAVKDFIAAIETNVEVPTTPAPVEPSKPTVSEWRIVGEDMVRNQQWITYDAAMVQWRNDLAKWEANRLVVKQDNSGRNTLIVAAKAKAQAQHDTIVAEYHKRRDSLLVRVTAYLNRDVSVFGEDGFIKLDPDRIVESRYYVATYVTDWGEESAPSPVSEMVEMDQNDSVIVTVLAPPAGRHIQKWRLYRSSAGSGSAAFLFVDEMLIATRTYLDELKGELLGEVCPTFLWAEPPYRLDNNSAQETKPPKGDDPYLRGFVGMPNGILAGFIDNFVAFSQPYVYYAWPVEYQISTEAPIVGLGVFGQSLFVGTMTYPYIISGADSASMSALKLPQLQPCVSRRSIVGVGDGVVYASTDGLCFANTAGVQLLTGELFSREDWTALEPAAIVAVEHESVYYFWDGLGRCWALDFLVKKLARVDLEGVTAVCRDVLTDSLFAVRGNALQRLFASGRRTGVWRGSKATFPMHTALAWVQVDGRQSEDEPVIVRWYGEGQLRHSVQLTDTLPQRLPPGRWLEHEIEVESAARLTKVVLASSTAELQSV
ncbi:hypothetical protein E8K88_12005 [Lampropedia aestuarii]|uniref:Uncharacterized protein n=1 Tax=Lampropedia aestuarii TaxID=2562762 RepID=A0A4S5BRR4_9BURK|nr:hypothetical protein [Lampropedia aestuarii]THJ32416.1 hypothetical protein E8K88_12005 [Lampropedia aestuarii]